MVSHSKSDGDAKICFEQTEYDFGQIERNSSGKCKFFFTNCSKNNLIINYVKTTCGCTEAKSNLFWKEICHLMFFQLFNNEYSKKN